MTGPIPPELGNLANLRWLKIYANKLSGEIPGNLLEISTLEVFVFQNNDGLCAPDTNAFTTWLMGIAEWRGLRCEPNQPPQAVSTIPGQTLVQGASATTIRLKAAFSAPDDDALTYSAVSADENVTRIEMSGTNLSVTPVAEGATTVSVTAADAEGLEASWRPRPPFP